MGPFVRKSENAETVAKGLPGQSCATESTPRVIDQFEPNAMELESSDIDQPYSTTDATPKPGHHKVPEATDIGSLVATRTPSRNSQLDAEEVNVPKEAPEKESDVTHDENRGREEIGKVSQVSTVAAPYNLEEDGSVLEEEDLFTGDQQHETCEDMDQIMEKFSKDLDTTQILMLDMIANLQLG